MRQNIRRLGRLDVPGLLDAVRDQERVFGRLSFREDMRGGPHGATQAIFLRWSRINDAQHILEGFDNVDYPALKVPAFRAAVESIEAALGKRVARALVIRLAPGHQIGEHTDQGAYADATDRYHLPILTNPFAWLQAGRDVVHLRAGRLYYFDKHVPHRGGNDGPYHRIHLVADVRR